MAVKAFNAFVNGFRTINGTHLNNLFTGQEQMQAVNTLKLTVGSQGASTDAIQKIALAVTATANTDITASIPAGAIIRSMTVYTTTAFTAVSDAQIQIGNAAAGAQYVAAVSIKALGIYALTLLGSAAAALANFPAGSPNLFVRIVQSGGSTAVGSATLLVSYVLP